MARHCTPQNPTHQIARIALRNAAPVSADFGPDRIGRVPSAAMAASSISTASTDLVRNPGMVSKETNYDARRFHRIVFQRCVRCLPTLPESFESLGRPKLSSQSTTGPDHVIGYK